MWLGGMPTGGGNNGGEGVRATDDGEGRESVYEQGSASDIDDGEGRLTDEGGRATDDGE